MDLFYFLLEWAKVLTMVFWDENLFLMGTAKVAAAVLVLMTPI